MNRFIHRSTGNLAGTLCTVANGRKVTWQRLVWAEGVHDRLNFAQLAGTDGGIAYAFTTLHSINKREVVLNSRA